MKLSIIIVSYNVRRYLEQCLRSVYASEFSGAMEVFVVDNKSVDNSCAMLRREFPQVKLIANDENRGFSSANNQAIRCSSGEYVLLLNPDTVIGASTLQTVCDFMDEHTDAGALGVKMIDGKGRFLPESKRGLPTPNVAFYKIFGLAKLFPHSKRFGQYHLSYLDKDKVHCVDVLSGAFMLLRKSVLNQIGLLDETFFMYGEDIDISYRITQAGYKNYYCPLTTIIHYKGGSTRKDSLNYVLMFYRAMLIFAKKHFARAHLSVMTILIKTAIYLRAFAAIVSRFFRSIMLPLIDALVLWTGFECMAPVLSKLKNGTWENGFPQDTFILISLIYIVLWLLSLLFAGGYDKPVKMQNVCKGIGVGTLLILAFYALLPTEFRFSRAFIIMNAMLSFITLPLIRLGLHFTGMEMFRTNIGKKRVAIVGTKESCLNLAQLLTKSENTKMQITTFVSPSNLPDDGFFAGTIAQLDEIVKINKINELVFCARSMQSQDIIKTMLGLPKTQLNYKIANPDNFSVIGSSTINSMGEMYDIDINSIGKPTNRRNKRLLDIIAALFMLPIFPLIIIFIKRPWHGFKNILQILIGRKTFVTYCKSTCYDETISLPKLKPGLFSPCSGMSPTMLTPTKARQLNIMYAKDYKLFIDINIIIRSWRKIGYY